LAPRDLALGDLAGYWKYDQTTPTKGDARFNVEVSAATVDGVALLIAKIK
jgi:hypothetical protein